MRKKAIPVNQFGNTTFSIERFAFSDLPSGVDLAQPERHDRHTFFLMESGSVDLEIDFERYQIKSPAVVYMHPDQVHRILGFNNITAIAWALTNELMQPAYLRQLEDITPAKPATLNAVDYQLFLQMAEVSLKLAESKAFNIALKDSLQVLTSLVITLYSAPSLHANRFEIITQRFKRKLEENFLTLKRPADYAGLLHISVAYLNECVKTCTGLPVTHHIAQRVILEAKRLLAHSALSVKEIAGSLGFEDYPYFCRLFRRTTGTTPLAFRNHG